MKAKKSVLFLLFIGLCAAAVSAQTEADFVVDLTADGAGVVIKTYVGKALQVRIPATIQGMPVREIAEFAFSGGREIGHYALFGGGQGSNSPTDPPTVYTVKDLMGKIVRQGITSVVIPEGVTKIGMRAFVTIGSLNSASLASVTIPNSVTEIGDGAFSGQPLTAVTLPRGLTKAGRGIFEGCTLRTVTIPEGVRVIGERMFWGCTALSTITIPQSVTSIIS
jgi:hypothetical protein